MGALAAVGMCCVRHSLYFARTHRARDSPLRVAVAAAPCSRSPAPWTGSACRLRKCLVRGHGSWAEPRQFCGPRAACAAPLRAGPALRRVASGHVRSNWPRAAVATLRECGHFALASRFSAPRRAALRRVAVAAAPCSRSPARGREVPAVCASALSVSMAVGQNPGSSAGCRLGRRRFSPTRRDLTICAARQIADSWGEPASEESGLGRTGAARRQAQRAARRARQRSSARCSAAGRTARVSAAGAACGRGSRAARPRASPTARRRAPESRTPPSPR